MDFDNTKTVIVGGGASGFFIAANTKNKSVIILEQAKDVLQKVKISGGGRCNLTNNFFDISQLVKFYPRGNKELKTVFNRFNNKNTIEWFEERNVKLKTEKDGRVFPHSDSSQSIIDCLINEAIKNNTQIKTQQTVVDINKIDDLFEIKTHDNNIYTTNKLIISAGSSIKMMEIIKKMGHKIIPPIPSLFTFNCNDNLIKKLSGTSFSDVQIIFQNQKIKENGDLLFTHFGLSGPAILKLSAKCAREFHQMDYKFGLNINFLNKTFEQTQNELNKIKEDNSKINVYKNRISVITQRFWENILDKNEIPKSKNYADLNKKELNSIINDLTNYSVQINGKNTNKDEFVTCGGVDLKEINFKTMESKIIKNLYFTGEILDIDAITGGFNFQACWSQGFIVSQEL